METVFEFLKKCGTYYLATLDGDQPRVRPFGTIDLFEGKIYFQTGKVKDVAHQLKKHSRVEICGLDGGKWIRVSANAIFDDNLKAEEHLLSAYPHLSAKYTPGDGNNEVYYLKNVTAKLFTQSGLEQEISF